jgi:NTE family protein
MPVKIGLALGSGVARGWAHIGILQALEARGIVPDIIAGTSIGALAGGCYAAGKLAELKRFALGLTKRRLFNLLDFSLGGSSLIKGRKLQDLLETHIGDITFDRLKPRFVGIATEMATGHEIWLRQGRLIDAMRASYALPGVFKPVQVDGRWLIDGALVNPIPVSICRALGARVVIAVNLNFDAFGRGGMIGGKLDDRALQYENGDENGNGTENEKGAVGSLTHLLFQQFFGKEDKSAPGISTVMFAALNISQDRIARSRLAGEPPDVTLTPKVGHIGLFDFDEARDAIARGEKAVAVKAERIADAIRYLA